MLGLIIALVMVLLGVVALCILGAVWFVFGDIIISAAIVLGVIAIIKIIIKLLKTK